MVKKGQTFITAFLIIIIFSMLFAAVVYNINYKLNFNNYIEEEMENKIIKYNLTNQEAFNYCCNLYIQDDWSDLNIIKNNCYKYLSFNLLNE